MSFYLRRSKNLDKITSLGKIIFPDDKITYDLNTIWWILWHKSSPVGFCGIRPVKSLPKTWFLTAAGLLPAVRGKRLQRRMINTRVLYAKKHAAKRIVTYTIDNPPSVENLIQCGFRPYAPEIFWVGKTAVYWELNL